MDYKALIENEQELHHHGVKGMKWGRRARAVGAWGKEFGRAYVNEYVNPHHAEMAKYKLAFRNGTKGLKYGLFSASTNALGYRNKVVDERVAAKKQYDNDKKKAKQAYKKNKKAYKAAKLISKTRYKKRLKEAGGDFESYVKQQKARNK